MGKASTKTLLIDLTDQQKLLVEYVYANIFAPWVLDMGLIVTKIQASYAELVLNQENSNLFRKPKDNNMQMTLSGQASMAIADSALIFAIIGELGEYQEISTVDLNTHFLRPVFNCDIKITAKILQLGRRLVRGQVDIINDQGKICVTSMVTYAFLRG